MSTERTPTHRKQQWQHHLEAWRSSGVSRAQYCRDNDLSYCVFNYWHAKLIAPKKSSNLVPVVVSPASVPTSTGTLQLELPNGMQITGIGSESVDLVSQLIAQL